MGRGDVATIRSLPRVFLDVVDLSGREFVLPAEELAKFTKVLRMKPGDQIAVLPNDGTIVRCELTQIGARALESLSPNTECQRLLTLALAVSKPDSLEDSVRMSSEMGVSRIVVFPSDRTVSKWDGKVTAKKLERLSRIARESAEVSFRTKMPAVTHIDSLETCLSLHPDAIVLSEYEGLTTTLKESVAKRQGEIVLVIGPEGGWTQRESDQIGSKAVTLGRRVLRVSTAVAAACAVVLIE